MKRGIKPGSLERLFDTSKSSSRLQLRLKGMVTGSYIYIFPNAESASYDGNVIFDSPEYQNLDEEARAARLKELAPRPVHVVRGRKGKLAICFGPPGETGNPSMTGTYDHGGADLSKAHWFNKAILPTRNSASLGSGTSPLNLDAVGGRFPFLSREEPTLERILEVWRSCSLFTGVSVGAGHIAVSGGEIRPGVHLGAHHFPAEGRHNLSGKLYNDAKTVFSVPGFAHVRYLGMQNGNHGRSLKWEYNGTEFAEEGEYVRHVSHTLGLVTSDRTLATYCPLPLCSHVLGYAVGLPYTDGPLWYEGEGYRTDGGGVLTIERYYTDYTLGFLKERFFKLDSMPEEKRGTVTAALEGIDDAIRFRSAWFYKKLDFGAIDIDDTRLARDLRKANMHLSDIDIENPDPTKPPMNLSVLAAVARDRIRKNESHAVTGCIDASYGLFSSTETIYFRRQAESGAITARQSGADLTMPAAVLSLRAGARADFDGVTRDTVAVEFFLLPSWDVVIDGPLGEKEKVKNEYEIDENVLTASLSFDHINDDQLARAIPFLIGYSRDDHTNVMVSQMTGYGRLNHLEEPADV